MRLIQIQKSRTMITVGFFGIVAVCGLIFFSITRFSSADSRCRIVPTRVEGASMSPRIAPDATVQIREGGPECFSVLNHNDVVLFNSASSKIPLIKAIRGVPGDTFAIHNGAIIINGATSTNSAGEPYDLSPPKAHMIDLYVQQYQGVIPSDLFLVMGENPGGTIDSSRFGLLPRDSIVGKMMEK